MLLAGGSKDAARELEQGLDALSAVIASPQTADLPQQIRALKLERDGLRSRSAHLNSRIHDLREVEHVKHGPIAPDFSTELYTGTLTEIVRDVRRNASKYDWILPMDSQYHDAPSLSSSTLAELLRLLRADTQARRIRMHQHIPEREELPRTGELADRFTSERKARETAHVDTSAMAQQLATTGLEALQTLSRLAHEARTAMAQLGYSEDYMSVPANEWVRRSVEDHFTGRHTGLWGHLLEVRGEASRLQQQLQAQGVTYVIDVPPIEALGIGTARGLLNAGRKLRDHLARGKKLHKVLPKSSVEKNAAQLLEVVQVDGQPPTALPQLDAALERLEAEVGAAQLVHKWADAGVIVATNRLTLTLSELDDNGRRLDDVRRLASIHSQVTAHLTQSSVRTDLSTVRSFLAVLEAVPAALNYVELEQARAQVDELHASVRRWAALQDSCPELGLLVHAIGNRDIDAYRHGLEALDIARAERDAQRRRAELTQALDAVHPQFLELLERTADDPCWDIRLHDLPAAWAWSRAEQFVQRWRNADEERRLAVEFDEVEDQIKRVTALLAAAEAMQACLARMSDNHARALRSYREHMNHIGAGTGLKTRQYRKAARAAMDKAKDAVPAWVVPLPNLLDNIVASRNSFDIVIVDEASQVGLEHLFLLWMAPRVIVVGDDKQCTPGENRMGKVELLWASLLDHLRDIDPEIRTHFTAKSNLFGLLSARSGKDAVVRLREHFRCMPEIINWSSRQFYDRGDGDRGLIPLRERTVKDLEPLKVVHVTDAYTEGSDMKRRNQVEAKQIVAQLVECLVLQP